MSSPQRMTILGFAPGGARASVARSVTSVRTAASAGTARRGNRRMVCVLLEMEGAMWAQGCPKRTAPSIGPSTYWCERGELNPHVLPPWILSHARLPVPPLSHDRNSQPASRNDAYGGIVRPRIAQGPRGPRRAIARASTETAAPSSSSFEPRIQRVADAVAEEVEAEHGEEDGGAGEGAQPWGLLEIAAAHGQHDAPRGRGGLRAHAEERERGLGKDAEGHRERGLDEQ